MVVQQSTKTNLNKMREHVGMAFQRFNLFPHMTVLENLIMAPMDVYKLSRQQACKQAKTLLAKVGLTDKIDAYPNSLSGGMESNIMLFDKPTSALDPELMGKVLKLDKPDVRLMHNSAIMAGRHSISAEEKMAPAEVLSQRNT